MDFNENRTPKSNIHKSAEDTVHMSESSLENTPRKKSSKTILIGISAIIGVIILGALIWWFIWGAAGKEETDADKARQEAEAQQIELEQQLAASELENATRDLTQLENQREVILNDTTKLRLTKQYEAARVEIERLQAQLKDNKNKSAAEIAKLRGEIDKLRALLKHYLEEIARLNKENEELRAENEQLSTDLATTTARAQDLDQRNQVLNERMTLAEKLNVTSVSLTPLNNKGKREKKVKKAKQLMVTFTIPQNNSTPVGQKMVFCRVISPEGTLLGGAGSFSFEGATVPCSAKKVLEYEGHEITGEKIYIDIATALTSGEYTVELFADNYRLYRGNFSLK